MVEAAEHGAGRNRALVRLRIIVEMPIFVEHALQTLFAPDDHVVEALATEAIDESGDAGPQ
jgi:hypothetical protein